MKTVICDMSAIEMWNRGLCKNAKPSKMKRLDNCAASAGEIPLDTFRSLGLGAPIHVMTAKENHRHRTTELQRHAWVTELPPKALVRLDSDLYVLSPEMCFYAMSLSRKTTFLDLLLLGDEICGLYATVGCPPREGHGGYSFFERPPLSSPDSLLRFLQGAGLTSRSKAMRVAKHVVAHSRSPMETATEILLCLPQRYGGYGFPVPLMNASVQLPHHMAKLTAFGKIKPDLLWLDAKIAIEYKGDFDHSSTPNRTRDAVRENLLQHTGITVITVTKAQFASIGGMYLVAKQLAGKMNRRIKLDIQSSNHENLHARLCEKIGMRQELHLL